MNLMLLDLINSFESDSKKSREKYQQFLIYVYNTFDKKIKVTKSDKLKNKYNQIRKSILQYIVANKKNIINKIK
jgi:hypothetical protein